MVRLGLDRLCEERAGLVRGRRVALLAHGASATRDLLPAARALLERARARLEFLLAPEHGLYGTAQDMEAVGRQRDPFTGLEVVSLYGATEESLSPEEGLLDGLDALVVDLQDVGARYYTFVWTAALCLHEAARAGVQVVVCDRPNPLGGTTVEGPLLEDGFESFVGLESVAVRHGMTVGEILALYADRHGLDVDLVLVEMEGWRRHLFFDQTGLPWVAPSPNMPTLDTALVYPGMCLVEATVLSEGRGTTTPFLVVGAPDLDVPSWLDQLERLAPSGVRFRPSVFRPMFGKHAGRTCLGVGLQVLDRAAFDPFWTGVCVLAAAVWGPWRKASRPIEALWRREPYEFVSERPALDLLTGSETLRALLEDPGSGPDDLRALRTTWGRQARRFWVERGPYLRYGREG